MQNKTKINRLELISTHFVKELRAIFSDKGALLILIGAMLIYSVVYSIGYFNEVIINQKVGVVDLDHSEMSRKYIRMLDATKDLEITHQPNSLMEAENLFMHNTIEGVVLIPKDFQSDILKGMPANVAVYADASYFLKYKTTYMAASLINSYFGAGVSITKYMIEGKSFDQAKIASDPLPVYYNILYNPASGYASYIMPGIILVIIQQTLLIGIGILGGSFSESKASPFILPENLRYKEIIPYLTGKAGAYLLVSLINVVYGSVLVHHWFSYPDKTSVFNIFMLLFPFVVAVTFLGIVISTLFKHRESAIVFMVFLSPIALFLSGLSWPISSIPAWLVSLSKVMPSTTVIPAYLRLRTMGVSFADLRYDVVFMYIQAAIYVCLTIAYFYARVYFGRRKKVVKAA